MDTARAIYDDLAQRGMRYKPDLASSPDDGWQRVEKPYSLLEGGSGLCLDVSILYASLCLGVGLVPMLVSFEGHMMVAISCDHWQSTHSLRLEGNFCEPIKEYSQWRRLVDAGKYFLVECNGLLNESPMRCGCRKNGADRGTLCFEHAMEEGRKYLDKNGMDRFLFTVDVSSAVGKSPEISSKEIIPSYNLPWLFNIFNGVVIDNKLLREAYQKSCNDRIQPLTVEDCIGRLKTFPSMIFHNFLLFIKPALSQSKVAELDAWISKELEAGTLEPVKAKLLLDRPVLLITIWASSDGRPGWLFQACLFVEAGPGIPIGPECDSSYSTLELPIVIEKLFTLGQDTLSSLRGSLLGRTPELLMELMLPDELLGQDVEGWLVPCGKKNKLEIGRRYAVALRSYERLHDDDYKNTWPDWVHKWKAIAGKQTRLSEAGGQVNDTVPVHLTGASGPWLATMIDYGVPVAIWLRGVSPPLMNIDDLAKIVGESPVEDLPWQIQKGRCADDAGPAPGKLALLFDDPNRLPPNRESSMQAPQ